MGRQRDDASSDSSTSEGSYNYHTDNDNSSIEGSDDGGNTSPSVHHSHVGSSSDRIPLNIETRPIVPPWMYSVEEEEYNADRDEINNVPACDMAAIGVTPSNVPSSQPSVPLRMRGGGGVHVGETVTDGDTADGIEEVDLSLIHI